METLLEIRNGLPPYAATDTGKVFAIRGAGAVEIGGDLNGLVGVGELYLKNMEDLYVTLADEATVELSVNTAAMIMVEHNVLYGGCLFFATYQSTNVIEMGDPAGNCEDTDTGTGVAVYKLSLIHI